MSSPRAPRPRNSSVARAAKAGSGSRNVWVIAAVAAVVIFAGIIAVALSQEESSKQPETAAVTVKGTPLPIQDVAASIGQTAPDLSGTSISGDPITIANDGRPKVVGFFAHWCPHCQVEVPRIQQWVNDGELPDDVDFVAVSTSIAPGQPNYPPSKWFDREKWTVPTLKDDATSTAHAAFGGGNFPYFVVLDAQNRVVSASSGELSRDEINDLIAIARLGADIGFDGETQSPSDETVEPTE